MMKMISKRVRDGSLKKVSRIREAIEDIEILRFIENGYRVQFIEVDSDTIAVDTPNDLERVREYVREHNL